MALISSNAEAAIRPRPGAPADIPGLELAGEVVECGPGSDPLLGRQTGSWRWSAAAARPSWPCSTSERPCRCPDGLDWLQAGGLPEVFTTAHDALFTQAGLAPGERLCVHGAAGGVGTAAVQLGVMVGARVTATVRAPERRAQVAALGATAVVDVRGWPSTGPTTSFWSWSGHPTWAPTSTRWPSAAVFPS